MKHRSWLWWVVAILVVVFVARNPGTAADLVATTINGIITFVTSVLSGLAV